jgi:endonuclease IV
MKKEYQVKKRLGELRKRLKAIKHGEDDFKTLSEIRKLFMSIQELSWVLDEEENGFF